MVLWRFGKKGNKDNSRYSYYESVNIIQQKGTLSNLFSDKFPTESTIESNGAINPLGVNFGFSERLVIKSLGEPNYRMKEGEINSLFYKIKSGNVKMYAQLHFYKSQLFLVNTDFSTLRHKPETLAATVFNSLRKKYMSEDQGGGEIEKIHLKDHDGHRIKFFYSGFLISVYYITGDKKLIRALGRILPTKERTEHRTDSDRVLDLV